MKKFIFMAFTALLVIGCNNSQQKGNAATPDFITFLRHHIAHNDNQRVT